MTPLSYTSTLPAPPASMLGSGLTLDPTPISRRAVAVWSLIIVFLYALLWSPDWYPLSDSSLFLGLARSAAAGRGLTIQGDEVRLIPPGTPRLIATIIKVGGGIGAIQAVMIAMMLGAHWLCYRTLRRWVGPWLGFYATVAGACSYWVFINAFTIMSEPPAMLFLWAAALMLSKARVGARGAWPHLIAGCAFLLLAAACRDAILVFVPGLMIALWVWNRDVSVRDHVGWIAMFMGVFAAWGIYRYPERLAIALPAALVIQGILAAMALIRLKDGTRAANLAGALTLAVLMLAAVYVNRNPGPVARLLGLGPTATRPTTVATTSTTGPVVAVADAPPINVDFDPDYPGSMREGKYRARWLYGVKRDAWHLATEPPVLAGRWVAEGLVAASSAVFENKKLRWLEAVGKVVGSLAFIMGCLGTLWLLMKRQWWMIPAALYFVSIWLQWGTRLKPRYMDPIAPLLFVVAASGTMVMVRWICKPFARKGGGPDEGKTLRVSAIVLLTCTLLGNAFPYAVEMYIRRVRPSEFYAVARRGAYADLVDIGAYLQRNARPEERVWLNDGAHRRIAYFLTGRPVQTMEAPCVIWSDWEFDAAAPKRGKSLRALRKAMPPSDRFVIVHVEQPAKGLTWPSWHLPLPAKDEKPPTWWRLYERVYGKNEKGETTETWKLITPPQERQYVRGIPPASY